MMNFKKKLILIIIFFSFLNANSHSEIVKKIEVVGNERISKETIVIFGDVALGKNYEISDVNSLIKKLYETSFFSDISVEIKNNTLNITSKREPNYRFNNFCRRKSRQI